MSEWKSVILQDMAEFNPRESIKKGEIAAKVAMDILQPFCRDIPEIEKEAFKCGAKFRNGDTIMARITPCLENGKTAMVNVLDKNEVGFGSTEYIVLRAKQEITDPYFLYYLVCSPAVREPAIKSMVGSSGRQRVQLDVVQNLELNIPPYEEQKKIGGFLKKLDDKIAVNNQINRNLSEQARSVYMETFGKFEKTKVLEDYPVKIYSGGTPSTSKKEYWEGGDIHWLSSGETANEFVTTTDKTITQLGVDNSSTKWASKYDVVTASAGQGHTRGQTTMILLNTCINQSVIVTHAAKEYMPIIFFNLSGRYEELRVLSDGTSTRGSLTTKIMAKLKMPDVTENTIIKFSDYAWSAISQIEVNLKENEKLACLRDSLLLKLMTGEIDVSDLNI